MPKKLKSAYRLAEISSYGLGSISFSIIENDDISNLEVGSRPFQIIKLKKATNDPFFDKKDVEKASGMFFPNAELVVKGDIMDKIIPSGMMMSSIRDLNWYIAKMPGADFHSFNLEKDHIITKNEQGKWERTAPQSVYPRQDIS